MGFSLAMGLYVAMPQAAPAAPEQWTALYNRGQPAATFVVGDVLDYPFEFAIDMDTSGWGAEYGLGTTTDGSDWSWYGADWSRMDGDDNRVWISRLYEHHFTTAGTWYYAGRFLSWNNPYDIYSVATAGVANSGEPLVAESYFTVNELSEPGYIVVEPSFDHPATRAEIACMQPEHKGVIVTMSSDSPTGRPEQGVDYETNDTFGNQTVVGKGEDWFYGEVPGLMPGQTYYFTFYSENMAYYSEGWTEFLTMGNPQARNTGGGAPEVPAEVFLGDLGLAFGCDAWGTLEGNWGRPRMWATQAPEPTEYDFGEWSDFTDAEHKTCVSPAMSFFGVGTWYWGIQIDYGAPYGDDFWYLSDRAEWSDIGSPQLIPHGPSPTVTVLPLNDPTNQTATRSAFSPESEIDLTWSPDAQGHDVMVARKPATGAWIDAEYMQGMPLEIGMNFGDGTVVWKGPGTSCIAAGLEAGTTYDFKFYSVNNDFYSPGVEAQASTFVPDPPTDLSAIPGDTDFTANWSASEAAAGYRIDVSTNADFSIPDIASTVFRETMGEVESPTSIADHEAADGFDNDAYTMTSISNPTDIRGDSASAGYIDPAGNAASGGGNVWFDSLWDFFGFGIAGIDALGYDYLRLSFGYRKEAGPNVLAIQWSTNNGYDWHYVMEPPFYIGMPAESTPPGWYMVTNLYLPPEASGTNLSLRWIKSWTNGMRLDDVLLQGMEIPSPCIPGYENRAVAGTSVSVTGLTEGVTYYFRVRAEGAAGGTSANSSTASVTTLASKADQTIDFPAIGAQWATSVVALTATASSGLPVSFAVASGPGSLDGATLTFTGAGNMSVVASQGGDENWNAAPDATNTFTVAKATAGVVLSGLSQMYDGTPKSPTVATEPAGLAVDVTYDGSGTAPSAMGDYEVVAIVTESLYAGGTTSAFSIVSVTNIFEKWLEDGPGQDPEDPDFAQEADVDGDGMTTWQEFLADTDPSLFNSVLMLTGQYTIATTEGGTGSIRLQFPASTSRFYQLEYCTDLTNHVIWATNLGWGVPGMAVTNYSTGAWYGSIRVFLREPE